VTGNLLLRVGSTDGISHDQYDVVCCCHRQAVEDEKLKMRKQVTELQQQLQQVESSSATSRQQLLSTQQMLSTKINELYEMNDKLADLLHASSLAWSSTACVL